MWSVVFLNLLLLFFFKYFNMFVAMIETIFALGRGEVGNGFWTELFSLQGTGELHIAKIVLPIGISFFTFQAMSYVIDVYQESTPPQRNILDFAIDRKSVV